MAVSVTGQASPTFIPGTVLALYKRSVFPGGSPLTGQGPPPGALVVESATVAESGQVVWAGLEGATSYVYGAEVGGVWRWVSFLTESEAAATGGGLSRAEVQKIAAEASGQAFAIQGASTIPVGTAVNYAGVVEQAYGAEYVGVLTREFSQVVPETELKMEIVANTHSRAVPAKLDFSRIEAMMAKLGGKGLRGHTWIWHTALPEWVTNPEVPWTEATMEAVLERLTKEYARLIREKLPMVRQLDIFNEICSTVAVEELREPGHHKGGEAGATEDQSAWLAIFGGERQVNAANKYLKMLAKIATWFHEEAPYVDLFISETAVEINSKYEEGAKKGNTILKVCEVLVELGAPLAGVTLEGHQQTGGFPKVDEFRAIIRRFKAIAGGTFRFGIGELDVEVQGAATLATQAEAYREMVLAAVAEGCDFINVWGFSDLHSWRGASTQTTGPRACVYDTLLKPKPALQWIQWARRARPGYVPMVAVGPFAANYVAGARLFETVIVDPTAAERTVTVRKAADASVIGAQVTVVNIAVNGKLVKIVEEGGAASLIAPGAAAAAEVKIGAGDVTLIALGGKWYVLA